MGSLSNYINLSERVPEACPALPQSSPVTNQAILDVQFDNRYRSLGVKEKCALIVEAEAATSKASTDVKSKLKLIEASQSFQSLSPATQELFRDAIRNAKNNVDEKKFSENWSALEKSRLLKDLSSQPPELVAKVAGMLFIDHAKERIGSYETRIAVLDTIVKSEPNILTSKQYLECQQSLVNRCSRGEMEWFPTDAESWEKKLKGEIESLSITLKDCRLENRGAIAELYLLKTGRSLGTGSSYIWSGPNDEPAKRFSKLLGNADLPGLDTTEKRDIFTALSNNKDGLGTSRELVSAMTPILKSSIFQRISNDERVMLLALFPKESFRGSDSLTTISVLKKMYCYEGANTLTDSEREGIVVQLLMRQRLQQYEDKIATPIENLLKKIISSDSLSAPTIPADLKMLSKYLSVPSNSPNHTSDGLSRENSSWKNPDSPSYFQRTPAKSLNRTEVYDETTSAGHITLKTVTFPALSWDMKFIDGTSVKIIAPKYLPDEIDHPQIEQIEESIAKLRLHERAVLKTFVIMPVNSSSAAADADGYTGVLRSFSTGSSDATILHEIGHLLSLRSTGRVLRPQLQQDFQRGSAKDLVALSEYSGKNLKEGVAESYCGMRMAESEWDPALKIATKKGFKYKFEAVRSLVPKK
jgi:hypothetical protein